MPSARAAGRAAHTRSSSVLAVRTSSSPAPAALFGPVPPTFESSYAQTLHNRTASNAQEAPSAQQAPTACSLCMHNKPTQLALCLQIRRLADKTAGARQTWPHGTTCYTPAASGPSLSRGYDFVSFFINPILHTPVVLFGSGARQSDVRGMPKRGASPRTPHTDGAPPRSTDGPDTGSRVGW